MREAMRVLVVGAGVGAAVAVAGCKKHEAPATSGSAAGSAATGSNIGSNVGSNAGSNAGSGTTSAGSAALPKLGAADVMMKETIGGIAIGDPAAKIEKLLGKPASRGTPDAVETMGMMMRTWDYGTSTVTLGKGLSKSDHNWTAWAWDVRAPSTWATSRGIHIGSSRADVLAAYDGSDGADGYHVGDDRSGETFEFTADKVTDIFLGTDAE